MKIVLRTIVLLLLVNSAFAQQPENVYSVVKQIRPNEWYVQQAKLWQQVLEKDKQNVKAWRNYYAANRMILVSNGWNKSKAIAMMTDSLNGIVDKMGVAIPNSFEYNFIMSWNSSINDKNDKEAYLQKAYAIDPDRVEVYEDFATRGEFKNDEQQKEKFLKKWYDANDLSPSILNWNYNSLMSVGTNAILFTGGDNDTYGAWMLQAAKGLRKDVKVVNLYILLDDNYRKGLCKELNIPYIKFDENKPDEEQKKEIGEYIIKNIINRPVYFAATVDPAYYKTFEDSMYLEGLALKFSKNKYDNITVMKNNVEDKFLMDYLKQSFTNDISESVVHYMNTVYIAPLLSLCDYYAAKKEKEKAAHYKELALKVGADAGKKEEVEAHFKN